MLLDIKLVQEFENSIRQVAVMLLKGEKHPYRAVSRRGDRLLAVCLHPRDLKALNADDLAHALRKHPVPASGHLCVALNVAGA